MRGHCTVTNAYQFYAHILLGSVEHVHLVHIIEIRLCKILTSINSEPLGGATNTNT